MKLLPCVLSLFAVQALILPGLASAAIPYSITTSANLYIGNSPPDIIHLTDFRGVFSGGGSRTHSFRIHNLTGTTATLSYDFAGDYFSLGDIAESSLVPGTFAVFEVKFQPTSPGITTSTLTVTASGHDMVVNLKGSGQLLPISLPTPDLALLAVKRTKAKNNKKTGLVDARLKLQVANHGLAESTSPTIHVSQSPYSSFSSPLDTFASLQMKPLPTPVDGKVKFKKVTMKLTGLPNDAGYLYIWVDTPDADDTDYQDNAINKSIWQ